MHLQTAVINESDLILALRQGCPLAFRQLVETFQEKVINTCLGFVPNLQDAEDICQETFIEIYRSISKFRGDSKLSTWVYRVAVSKSLDHLKAKKRKKRIAFITSLNNRNEEPFLIKDFFNHPGVVLENKERSTILFAAIDKLPSKQKTVYVLNKIEGLSYKEVAAVIHLSVSSIESLLYRAKKNLQKLLKAYYEAEMIA